MVRNKKGQIFSVFDRLTLVVLASAPDWQPVGSNFRFMQNLEVLTALSFLLKALQWTGQGKPSVFCH
jgi:hypothetical protein